MLEASLAGLDEIADAVYPDDTGGGYSVGRLWPRMLLVRNLNGPMLDWKAVLKHLYLKHACRLARECATDGHLPLDDSLVRQHLVCVPRRRS